MGYLIVVNGEVKITTIFRNQENAIAQRGWWEQHLKNIGLNLISFEVVKFNPANIHHHLY